MPFVVGFSNYEVLFCALMETSPSRQGRAEKKREEARKTCPNRGQSVLAASRPIVPREGSGFGGLKVDDENVRGGRRATNNAHNADSHW